MARFSFYNQPCYSLITLYHLGYSQLMAEKDQNINTCTDVNTLSMPEDENQREEQLYECSKCDFSTNYEPGFRTHLITVHAKRDFPYKCEHPKCDFSGKKPYILKRHMKKHANGKEYACELCNYRSISEVFLASHKRKKHLRDLSDEELVRQSQAYKCAHCDLTFVNTTQLQRHEATHLSKEDKPHSCTMCDFKACSFNQITHHVNIKHKKVTFACEKCDFTATTKHNFQKHVSKCVGAHPYTCTKCEYKTAVLKNLYAHAETHVAKA